jgi:tRNA pseudouridine55 synthase
MLLNKSAKSQFKEWLNLAQTDGAVALIDKDKNWTSFDVIGKLRPTLNIRKIGHAGTLDPLATGLLILCLGKSTKKINEYQDLKKGYRALIKLGATTKSYDSEFEEENIKDISSLNIDQIKETVNGFVNEFLQIPPQFSAKKVGGVRSYDLARKNKEIELKPNLVTVYKMDIKDISLPYIDIEVECSKGTYIRSLARDIGEALNVGGYLKELRRICIGDYSVDDALKIEEIVELSNNLKNEYLQSI